MESLQLAQMLADISDLSATVRLRATESPHKPI